MRLVPALRTLDTLGGLVAGALLGLFVVWVLGAVALEFPGQTTLRRDVMRSELLQRLNEIAPPTTVLHALDLDQLPTLLGPAPPLLPSDPAVLSEPAVRAAEASIVRVTDTACGLGVEGSGWVARPHLVVTAAHVVAGGGGILVDDNPAQIYAINRRDDVAVLDVPDLSAHPLRFASPTAGTAVAILGYPEDGGFNAQAGRIGATATTEVNGTPRRVTEFSGLVRPGNSGGPALDAAGVVETTVFARLEGVRAGLGVPAGTVASTLASAHGPVPAGGCWSG
jgi:S1-C subfamily serine protease